MMDKFELMWYDGWGGILMQAELQEKVVWILQYSVQGKHTGQEADLQ